MPQKAFFTGSFSPPIGSFSPPMVEVFSPAISSSLIKKEFSGSENHTNTLFQFQIFFIPNHSRGYLHRNFLACLLSNASNFRLWTLAEAWWRIYLPSTEKAITEAYMASFFLTEKNSLQHPPPLVFPGGL